jgi:hypothetical protein
MTPQTLTALKAEIARLERELARHQHALRLLEGHDGQRPLPGATTARGPAARSQRQAARAGAKPAKAHPGGASVARPSLRAQIQGFLRRHAARPLTPGEIAQGLTRQGQPANRDNVQRRLSEMAKAKQVIRQEGKYRLAR